MVNTDVLYQMPRLFLDRL